MTVSITSDALVEHMRTTAGAMSRAQIEQQWSSAALRVATRAGDVTRMLPGIYAASLHARSLHTRAHAVALWGGGAIIGLAACHLFDLADPPRAVRVASERGRYAPATPWLRVNRIEARIPTVTRPGDVPVAVARPAFAVVTGYGELGPDTGADLVYRAVQRGKVDAATLTQALDTLPRVRGRERLTALVRAVGAGAESHLETRGLRTVFSTQAFAGLIRQHEVVVEGRLFRLDTYDRASRTAIELDGGTHADPRQRERDIERDAILATQGILTVRLSWAQVTREPEWCRRIILETLRSRS